MLTHQSRFLYLPDFSIFERRKMIAHIVCSSCKIEYRTETWPGAGECTSHGMCPKCAEQAYYQLYLKRGMPEAEARAKVKEK